MMLRYKIDDHGKPVECPFDEWYWWHEALTGRVKTSIGYIVQVDEVCGGGAVSTVFLSIDHRFDRLTEPDPVLWETLVFGGPLEDRCERYTSEADAIEGHKRILEEVRLAVEEQAK